MSHITILCFKHSRWKKKGFHGHVAYPNPNPFPNHSNIHATPALTDKPSRQLVLTLIKENPSLMVCEAARIDTSKVCKHLASCPCMARTNPDPDPFPEVVVLVKVCKNVGSKSWCLCNQLHESVLPHESPRLTHISAVIIRRKKATQPAA
jgi:hypothetical protein